MGNNFPTPAQLEEYLVKNWMPPLDEEGEKNAGKNNTMLREVYGMLDEIRTSKYNEITNYMENEAKSIDDLNNYIAEHGSWLTEDEKKPLYDWWENDPRIPRRLHIPLWISSGFDGTGGQLSVPLPELSTILPPEVERKLESIGNKIPTGLFWLFNRKIANEIGEVITGQGTTNISTNATRFSYAFDLDNKENMATASEGTQVNALRHAIWIATIIQRYGEKIALEVGNAHEQNPHALEKMTDPYNYPFSTSIEADEAIDLLNNIIGREIGKSAQSSSMKDIALASLEYYYKKGMNEVVIRNGRYYIAVKKISYQEYNNAIAIWETLDENGFPPDDEYYNNN